MSCKSKSPACLGELRTKVEFYSNQGTPDSFGQYGAENQLTLVHTANAKIEDMSGNEALKFERVAAKAGVKIIIRYSSVLKFSAGNKLSALIDGEYYNVRHIKNWERRNRWLTIRAEAGVAQ